MTKNSDLVYSTDPELNKTCARCKKILLACTCDKETGSVDKSKIDALVHIEKKHRGGKEVTIVERLPPSEEFLGDISRLLKKKCGAGGTYKIVDKNGIVEIQGDKREQVKSELGRQGIKCR